MYDHINLGFRTFLSSFHAGNRLIERLYVVHHILICFRILELCQVRRGEDGFLGSSKFIHNDPLFIEPPIYIRRQP